jgi:1-deoxy-D-xylulose-5-phosphate synthase
MLLMEHRQHAVTLSTGMATQGMVVFATYIQPFTARLRQVIHDGYTKLAVVLLNRAGLVGERGNTPWCLISAYLRCIPTSLLHSPLNECITKHIYTAQWVLERPLPFRYPRGSRITVNPVSTIYSKYEKLKLASQTV